MIEPTFCDSLELGQYVDADTYKMVYDDGTAIQDEYYRNSSVDSGGADDMLTFDTLPVSWDESAQQPCSVSITQPSASKALTHRTYQTSVSTQPCMRQEAQDPKFQANLLGTMKRT